MDNETKSVLAGALASIAVWWYFSGRKKYMTKGMS